MADNPKNEIDEDLVRNLTRLLEENNLTEIEYGRDGWHIKVGRGGGVTVSESRRGKMDPDGAAAPEDAADAVPVIDLANAVTSPMVGVVFTGPEKDAPPFVNVGDQVTEGQTLLLIEAMKVFNPITATKAGRVTEILITNGAPVEYGEPLLIIE